MFNASTLCSTTATRATGTVLYYGPNVRFGSGSKTPGGAGSRDPLHTDHTDGTVPSCSRSQTSLTLPNSHVRAVVPTRADRTHGAGLYKRCRRRSSFTCVARRWTAHRPCGSRRSSTWILQQYGPRPRCSFRAASPPRVEQGGHASSQHCRSTARRSTTPR